jgi:hypothetical protein
MGKRNGLSRGDARRNARLLRLRGVVRQGRAILAIDLADTSQALGCVTMTGGCWPAAACAATPGSWRRRCAGDGRSRSSTALPASWWAASRPGPLADRR